MSSPDWAQHSNRAVSPGGTSNRPAVNCDRQGKHWPELRTAQAAGQLERATGIVSDALSALVDAARGVQRHVDRHTSAPAGAEVPLADIRRAVHEFVTGGSRPIGLSWQPAP
jgi:hypothetical protein